MENQPTTPLHEQHGLPEAPAGVRWVTTDFVHMPYRAEVAMVAEVDGIPWLLWHRAIPITVYTHGVSVPDCTSGDPRISYQWHAETQAIVVNDVRHAADITWEGDPAKPYGVIARSGAKEKPYAKARELMENAQKALTKKIRSWDAGPFGERMREASRTRLTKYAQDRVEELTQCTNEWRKLTAIL